MPKNSHPTTKKISVTPKLGSQKPKRDPRSDVSRDPQSAVSPWIEDYLDLGVMRLKPVNLATIERLAKEVLDWSLRNDALVFRDFLDKKGIPEDTYYRWVRTFPDLKAAHTMAKGRVGSRREKGALFKKMDSGIVTLGLGKYDNQWKEFLVWKASLKEDQSKNIPVTININDLSKKHTLELD